MRAAGKAITSKPIVAGLSLLLAGCATPLIKVDYHNSAPPPAAAASAPANNGSVPLVAADGTVLRSVQAPTMPQRMPDAPQANTIGGYNVSYQPVPNTNLTMPTIIRGNQVWVGYPGDQVQEVNSKPNATISINAEKLVLIHMGRNNQLISYDPIPLPYNTEVARGANPWTAAENGATRYITNGYTQDRANRYGFMEPIPTAITQQGQAVPSGFPIRAAQGRGFTTERMVGFSFSIGPNGVPTGQTVPLQTLTR